MATTAAALGRHPSFVNALDVDESEDEIVSDAGRLYAIYAVNLAATPLYLKLYDATAANTTVGTTVPLATFTVPSQGTTNGAGFVVTFDPPEFFTALTLAATTAAADADTGAPGADELNVVVRVSGR